MDIMDTLLLPPIPISFCVRFYFSLACRFINFNLLLYSPLSSWFGLKFIFKQNKALLFNVSFLPYTNCTIKVLREEIILIFNSIDLYQNLQFFLFFNWLSVDQSWHVQYRHSSYRLELPLSLVTAVCTVRSKLQHWAQTGFFIEKKLCTF